MSSCSLHSSSSSMASLSLSPLCPTLFKSSKLLQTNHTRIISSKNLRNMQLPGNGTLPAKRFLIKSSLRNFGSPKHTKDCQIFSNPDYVQDCRNWQSLDEKIVKERIISATKEDLFKSLRFNGGKEEDTYKLLSICSLLCGVPLWLGFAQIAQASEEVRTDMVYEIGELFELGIQLSYLLVLLALLGVGTFYVIRQVLVRRELDLSAKELQEQVRSGDASGTGYFELGAVMLRRKFYPAAIKYLQQAIEKWDRDDSDLAQVYNALGVSYVRDNKLDKGIAQFETAVKLQPGYVTAWNNLGDAYEKKKDLRAALKAFEEVLLFDPNNKVARPRRDALRDRVRLYRGVPLKSEDR